MITTHEVRLKINYISVDKNSAISSYGDYFYVGEEVTHSDKNAVGVATIESFEIDEKSNEVLVNTTLGYAHLDFINKAF